MTYLFIFLVIVLIIVILNMWNELYQTKLLKTRLRNEWGEVPEEEYTSEKLRYMKAYYESNVNQSQDVDDITWNDLDMEEIYMLMNNTQSSVGEEYLYAMLRKPCFTKEELEERNRLIEFFEKNENQRISLQLKLRQIGKISRISVYEYMNRLHDQESKSNIGHYLMDLGLLISIGMLALNPGIGGICIVLFVIYNIFQYYKEKTEIENYLMVFSFIFRLLDQSREIYKLEIPQIKEYADLIKQDSDQFKRFKKSAGFLTPKKASGSLADMILDYIRMLTHIDLILYNSMLQFFKEHRAALNRIFETVGYLDSMIAAASFRSYLPYYSKPVLNKQDKPFLNVEELYHPLIEEPVVNNIKENKSVLLTGSNASGKSTFIKTLALNTILSQTIHTSVSSYYEASFFKIFSSMALRDNLLSKESYYIVEIKSLKRILDYAEDKIPTLCFIDEVLRGTNTTERIAASSRILKSLALKHTLVFAATHDIELTHILEDYYSNYHFQEKIDGNQIIFDYKLYSGRAVSKNAIKLLNMLHYPEEVTQTAEQAAEEFLTKGEWSKV